MSNIKDFASPVDESKLLFGFELENQSCMGKTKNDEFVPDPLTDEQYAQEIANETDTLFTTRLIDYKSGYETVKVASLIPLVASWINQTTEVSEDFDSFVVTAIKMHRGVVSDPTANIYWESFPIVATDAASNNNNNGRISYSIVKEGADVPDSPQATVKIETLVRGFSLQSLCELLNIEGSKTAATKKKLTTMVKKVRPKSSFEQTVSAMDYFKSTAPSLIGIVNDATVSGFEMRTKTPLNSEDIRTAVDQVFTWEYTIDEKCSFHVHISETGKTNTYSAVMQTLLCAYIVDHFDEVPESVRARWANAEWMDSYYALALNNDPMAGNRDSKYRFIAYRPSHKSWEFRCFGNIDNPVDANRCIDLAKSAFVAARLKLIELIDNPSGTMLPSMDGVKVKFALLMKRDTATIAQLLGVA